jgi:hypothetical protein
VRGVEIRERLLPGAPQVDAAVLLRRPRNRPDASDVDRRGRGDETKQTVKRFRPHQGRRADLLRVVAAPHPRRRLVLGEVLVEIQRMTEDHPPLVICCLDDGRAEALRSAVEA